MESRISCAAGSQRSPDEVITPAEARSVLITKRTAANVVHWRGLATKIRALPDRPAASDHPVGAVKVQGDGAGGSRARVAQPALLEG